MKDKDIYKKRVDPSKVKFTEYRRGVYGSYGNRDLKTYQCKLPREPFEEFDKKRKEYHMNKNEILLGFIEYYNRVISIERKDLANKQHFTKNETIKKQFMEYKQKMYKKYIEPLVSNGITTDLENGISVDMKRILDNISKEEE